MCNLSKGVEDRGIAIGMAQGITIGAERMTLAAIQRMMDKLGITANQAMAVLEVPQSEQEKYRRMLEQ